MVDEKTLIYGGITVPCTLRAGDSVSVRLRLIKISEIPKYLDLALDEMQALKFCIAEPANFDPDTLTDESFSTLADKNTELNFTRALAMSDQRLKRAEASGIGLAQLAANLGSVLQRYLPNSPSPAASPASKSST